MNTSTLTGQSTATIGLESITLEQIRSAIVELIAAHPSDSTRIQRGARLLATATPEEVDGVRGVWIVASEETAGAYYIVMQGPTVKADGCTCPDFKNRGARCKHIYSVRVLLACIGCGEPTTERSGEYPLCPPCAERDSRACCSKCGQPAALSQGICGSCLVKICFQD